jgi:hypothetical protein
LLDGGHKKEETGGPGERAGLSYLQGSKGSGGRRGCGACKSFTENEIEVLQKL